MCIRCYGQEIGFSTGVEVRPVTVMEEMMKDTPRVVLDLGRTELSADEVNALVAEMAADKSWSTADAYDIFVHNSIHFGVELAERLVKEPLPSTTLHVSDQRADFERIAAMSERIWKKHQAMGPPLNSPFVSPLDSPLDVALPVEDLTARGRSREAFGGKQAAAGSRALSNRLAAARRTLMNAFEEEHDGANGVPEERVRSVPNGRLQGYPSALEESGEYPLREVASSSVEARGMATSMASIVTLALFMMFSVFSLSFESPAW